MKRFRFLLIGMVLALSVIAVGHAASQRHVVLQTWYLVSGGDPTNPDDYSGSDQGFNCGGALTICSIQAANVSGKPDLSAGDPRTNQAAYTSTFHN
jgi:hypothetical protein